MNHPYVSGAITSRPKPNAFADPIDETRGDQPTDGRREREDRLGGCRQSIADDSKQFALAQPVRERAGKQILENGADGLSAERRAAGRAAC